MLAVEWKVRVLRGMLGGSSVMSLSTSETERQMCSYCLMKRLGIVRRRGSDGGKRWVGVRCSVGEFFEEVERALSKEVKMYPTPETEFYAGHRE